ncbi:MAG TPA: hypothetical protein VG892_03760 [Terriglobales bacterium]|nr:hypothetical protein [Terriglobales bacterium]
MTSTLTMFCTLPEANLIHKKVPEDSCEKAVTFEEFLWMEEEKRGTISPAKEKARPKGRAE